MISQISETRRPFDRRHDQSCVYYGIRGNARSQYLFDKSCVLEGGGLGTGVMPVILGQMPTLLGTPEVTLLGRGATLLGDANLDVLQRFLEGLRNNPTSTFYVSQSSSGTGGGEVNGITFVVISKNEFAAINQALSAAGRAALRTSGLDPGGGEQFIPDAAERIGPAASLVQNVQAAIDVLALRVVTGNAPAAGGMSTKVKVLLGLGAAAVIGGVALIALSPSEPHRQLRGPARRRRRRR